MNLATYKLYFVHPALYIKYNLRTDTHTNTHATPPFKASSYKQSIPIRQAIGLEVKPERCPTLLKVKLTLCFIHDAQAVQLYNHSFDHHLKNIVY